MKACAHICTRALNFSVGYSTWSMQKSGTDTGTGPCSIVTPFFFNLGWVYWYPRIHVYKLQSRFKGEAAFFKVIRDCWLHCSCSLRPCTDLKQNPNLLKFCWQENMVRCRHQMMLRVLQVSFVSQSYLFFEMLIWHTMPKGTRTALGKAIDFDNCYARHCLTCQTADPLLTFQLNEKANDKHSSKNLPMLLVDNYNYRRRFVPTKTSLLLGWHLGEQN